MKSVKFQGDMLISYDFIHLKEPNKIAADNIFFIFVFLFYISKKIKIDVSCESSARGFT